MKSIHRHLGLSLLVVLLLLVATFGSVLYLQARRVLLEQFDEQLRDRALDFTYTTELNEEGEYEFELATVTLPRFEPSDKAEFYQVWSVDGSVLLRSPSLRNEDLSKPDHFAFEASFDDLVLPDGRDGRCIAVEYFPRIEESEEKDLNDPFDRGKHLFLVMARSRVELDGLLNLLLLGIILAGIALPIFAGLLVRRSIRTGLQPLIRLGKQAATIDAAKLSQRFPTEGIPDELLPIHSGLNDMLARLESSFARERRFVDNAAHELRTPIAELRSLSEVALRGDLDPEMREAFVDALDIALQMGKLTDALLAIARSQSGKQQLELSLVDFTQLIRDCWQRFGDLAAEKNLEVEIDIARGLKVKSDGSVLSAIMENIFSNALSHSTPGAKIRIEAVEDAGGVRVTVGNSCHDLEAGDLKNLFEPFWRKDDSRTDSSHAGLGLYLVQSYAKILHFELSTRLEEENWFEIVLRQ